MANSCVISAIISPFYNHTTILNFSVVRPFFRHERILREEIKNIHFSMCFLHLIRQYKQYHLLFHLLLFRRIRIFFPRLFFHKERSFFTRYTKSFHPRINRLMLTEKNNALSLRAAEGLFRTCSRRASSIIFSRYFVLLQGLTLISSLYIIIYLLRVFMHITNILTISFFRNS